MQDTYDVVGVGAGLAGLGRTPAQEVHDDPVQDRTPPGTAADLVARRAVAARTGGPFSAAAERQVCELVLGDRRHGLRGNA